MKKKGLRAVIMFFVAGFLLSGCATTGLQQSFGTKVSVEESVNVKLNVLLERAYIQSVSNLGAGAIAMWVIAGPFSNNVIMLYGTVREKVGDKEKTVGSFSKGLQWGENSFDIRVPKNSEIQFRLRSGGTRSGITDVGFATIGSDPTQTIVINLLGSGVTIE